MDRIAATHPGVMSMEMETFQLLHMAACSKGSIQASAASIVVANRPTGKVVAGDVLEHLESAGGRAIMTALASVEL